MAEYPKNMLNEMNESKYMPLHVAALHNNLEITKALISLGATNDIRGKNDMTPLFCAIDKGYIELIDYYLSLKTTNVNTLNNFGVTPLGFACNNGNLTIVKKLLRHPNVDVNAGLYTPHLIAAVNMRRFEIIAELLTHPGININIETKEGHNARYLAVEHGFWNC